MISPPNTKHPFQYAEVWNKANDYLYELSIYERTMAESLFNRDYETCLRAADLILMKISFLLKDKENKGGKIAQKVIARGTESDKFKDIRVKISIGLKYAVMSKMQVKNRAILAFHAFNISREVFLEITNCIAEAELYFRKGGDPGTAISRGLDKA